MTQNCNPVTFISNTTDSELLTPILKASKEQKEILEYRLAFLKKSRRLKKNARAVVLFLWRYPMSLSELDSTANILIGMSQLFLEGLFYKAPKHI